MRTNHIPAVDTTATGHLPYTVQTADHERHSVPVTDGAREHIESLLTPEQTALVLDDGLGARITAPVETELRDIDSAPDPDLKPLPFLGAQVVVSDYRSQAYGRHTKVWVHNGTSTGELSPAEARGVLNAVRAFLPRLEAVVAFAEQEAVGDFEGDPEVEAADSEAENRRIAAITARAGGAR